MSVALTILPKHGLEAREHREGGRQMERFNRSIVVVLAVMLAITAAGCGGTTSGADQSLAGGGSTTPEAATASPAPSSPAATVPAEVVHVSVTFNGTDCAYAGPAVFPRGASVEFAFANTGAVSSERDQALLLVGAVKAGTTWREATQAAETIPASAWPPPFADWSHTPAFLYPPAGTMTMDLVGDAYYVGCGTAPDSTDRYYSGALLQTVDG